MAHNSIPHHHHSNPAEICCANKLNAYPAACFLNTCEHSSGDHHDACCFNPEFTLDLFKLLTTAVTITDAIIECPLKWLGQEPVVCMAHDALSRIDTSPNLLRGPPAIV